MANFDLDAIKRKLAQLSGKGGKSVLWKPKEGEHVIRLISIPNDSGMPFIERWFYYLGMNTIVSPFQFGKPDPIKELIDQCWASNDRETAKTLSAKRRTYAAVVVRGEEDKGVQLWGFGVKVYQQLLNIFMDADYGDITDPDKGHDIKITLAKQQGQEYAQVASMMPKPKASKLSTDQKQLSAWLDMDKLPSIDDAYPEKTYEQINSILKGFLGVSETPNGTVREGSGGIQTLHVGANESNVKPSKQTPVADVSVTKSLDEAFAEFDR